jgi:hypothetical protein
MVITGRAKAFVGEGLAEMVMKGQTGRVSGYCSPHVSNLSSVNPQPSVLETETLPLSCFSVKFLMQSPYGCSALRAVRRNATQEIMDGLTSVTAGKKDDAERQAAQGRS